MGSLAKIKRKIFPNHACFGCGKLLLRKKDRISGFKFKTVDAKRHVSEEKNRRYCAECAIKMATLQLRSLGVRGREKSKLDVGVNRAIDKMRRVRKK